MMGDMDADNLNRNTAPSIAINGRFLTQKTNGVQRFAIETVKAIDAHVGTDAYRALQGRITIMAPPQARDFPTRNIPLRRVGFLSGYAWEQLEFPLHARGQTLLNLCMLGPLVTRRQVVVVHDATVRAVPDNFSASFRAAYGFLMPRLCRRADLTVTVSEFSRQEIGKWYGVDIDKIPICYEGGDHINATPADTAVLDRLGLRGKNYLLGVGVVSINKNINVLLQAFQRANLGDTQLILTGQRNDSVHGHFAAIDSANVRTIGYVSDAELRTLYEHALALVYPSRYEGFGLPPLEAMNCGCPVIISDQPALTEVAGDAALQCGIDDVAALSRLMQDVNTDPALRERLKRAGLERARRFTWSQTAKMLLDACINLRA